ncbi:MAG: hypothetical protein A2589_02265 [Candidatus Vogelbacteria bacterium RIFOXYD1_FULL_46_19]|uniref:Gfo/Idh/MocA-like oxidoreductase N-terminal domain-containing protein n=1 Tax=Candidatus Vogelbacteria bacterium RIFOXYD1_FULL_46_19 TaxID=1802439 RepID=A0A1G2QHU6_9BACT|nr:MAG: hypothetical protein A2589_02265 [Candidatus Vogelbacteria bacterium RIFOXYD1_FULL_46_19]
MYKRLPRIILVGVGRFGVHHERVLKQFHKVGKIDLVGIITKSQGPRLTTNLLKSVDAVDIVTPASTHYRLVKKCLPYCHVFVEKPLALNSKQAKELLSLAKRYNHSLVVGHIYRFHPVTLKLKSLIKNVNPKTCEVTGRFISPVETWRGEDPAFEKLHFFDVVDFLWGEKPDIVWTRGTNKIKKINLRYPNGVLANFVLGWQDEIKERIFTVQSKNKIFDCDFQTGSIIIREGCRHKTVLCSMKPDPLERELEVFRQFLTGQTVIVPKAEVGLKIIQIAERATLKAKKLSRPKIAVIGGGIFGLTVALHLKNIAEVTVFEREAQIMQGASKGNQYRHHMGYHYPRSRETISEIKLATSDFEKFYHQSIIRSFPAYYAIAKKGSLTLPKEFMKVCDEMSLPYEREYPPSEFLNADTVGLSLKTPEAVLDYDYLVRDIKSRLVENKQIKIKLKTEVVGASLSEDGQKILTIKSDNRRYKDSFDFVLNTTYVDHNNFCSWLGFKERNLEFRLKEIAIIRLSKTLPRTAVMIMDGPFATLVPLGNSDLYTFGDAPLSIHKIGRGHRDLLKLKKVLNKTKSHWPEMKKRCREWFPFLETAEYVNSMFVILPIEKNSLKDDARPTEVTDHSFGCFSVLSGKIITAVSVARKIKTMIQ